MAPEYKFVYFDAVGKGEVIRYLFKYGGIEFEDVRVNKDTEWPQMKEKTPFGQLPYLEHNGRRVAETIAIARYVAKQVNLAGKDDWENLEIDAVVDTFSDVIAKCVVAYHEKDETKRKILVEAAINEITPYYFTRLEAMAQKNSGYLAAGRLTWADIYFASNIWSYDKFTKSETLSKYPTLKALYEKVHSIPAIKKWTEIRPITDF